MPLLNALFQQLLRERSYLKNVSPKTQIRYETAWVAARTLVASSAARRVVVVGVRPAMRRGCRGQHVRQVGTQRGRHALSRES
jgi:hypothetical protein